MELGIAYVGGVKNRIRPDLRSAVRNELGQILSFFACSFRRDVGSVFSVFMRRCMLLRSWLASFVAGWS